MLLIPAVDRMVRVSLRTVTLKVPAQDVITRDNVPARVDAVVYFRIVDPVRSVVEIETVLAATSQIAQTTLRSVLGKAELDALLAERERLNEELQQIIDDQTEPWGVKVTGVEIKDVEIPRAHAARDRPPGRGRARAAREDHQRRGRGPGGRPAGRRRRRHRAQPGDLPAALPADAARGQQQPELDDRLPAVDRCRSGRCWARIGSTAAAAAASENGHEQLSLEPAPVLDAAHDAGAGGLRALSAVRRAADLLEAAVQLSAQLVGVVVLLRAALAGHHDVGGGHARDAGEADELPRMLFAA